MAPPEGPSDPPAGPSPVLGGAPAIVTPDAVPLDLEVATVGSRGAAFLVDLLIFGGVFVLLALAQLLLGGAGFVPGWLGIAVLLVLAFLWQFGYPIGFETRWRGRTPGKALLGLRVVTVEGAPVGVRHAAVRATTGLFELFATAGTVAIVTSLISSRSQRLGDLAAGTMVVREQRRARAPMSQTFSIPAGYERYVATLDVSAITPARYAAIRETLVRAHQLPPPAAAQVAGQLAAHVVQVVRPPPPAGCDPITFLTCVAAGVQVRRGVAPSNPTADDAPSHPPMPTPGEVPGRARPTDDDPSDTGGFHAPQ